MSKKKSCYLNATGKITYTFTNDYMFRAILQRNKTVLKGLICSLLHLDPASVVSITINNPIELGKSVDNKEFILDINITLNDDTLINLEMQVTDELNWKDRSLSYLCRTFDQLYRGQDYSDVSPVIHIGFLNFPLFPSDAEFYATYKLLNIKTHKEFSDKLTLGVVDLTHIELATDEDRFYQIDRWAKLFKATTWKELKNLTKGDEYMTQAAKELYECNSDVLIQQQCRAREEYYKYQRALEKTTEERDRLASENNQLVSENKKAQATLKAQAEEIQRLKALLEQ
ncbi:MAG: Rpn family recombination-promoting nuclease/putative transposase [Lachnospiraceae bacterium]|nr:Rpn family recombination-promoting nuclease/putative transposase [Lachnospiraceae bacterium]